MDTDETRAAPPVNDNRSFRTRSDATTDPIYAIDASLRRYTRHALGDGDDHCDCAQPAHISNCAIASALHVHMDEPRPSARQVRQRRR